MYSEYRQSRVESGFTTFTSNMNLGKVLKHSVLLLPSSVYLDVGGLHNFESILYLKKNFLSRKEEVGLFSLSMLYISVCNGMLKYLAMPKTELVIGGY